METKPKNAGLSGIIPVLTTPFGLDGEIDEASLRSVTRFELDGGVQGVGIGGFASEAYKLSDEERYRIAEIVASEVAGRVPLIIGIAPNSIEVGLQQAARYAALNPAALMTLPPSTMKLEENALIDYYVTLGMASKTPIMVQYAPQIPQFEHCALSGDSMAEIARRSPNVCYFKIEGPGSAERTAALGKLVPVKTFGGVGGIAMREELDAGASGLLPGCGFNEYFVDVWKAWERGDRERVAAILQEAQPLIRGVSLPGHEFSLHARKRLLHRVGVIATPYVRRPTVIPDESALAALEALVDTLPLRIARKLA